MSAGGPTRLGAPVTPVTPTVPSTSPLTPPASTPLVDDAQAIAERAALRFKTSEDRTSLEQQGAYDKTDFQEALRRMAVERPETERQTKEGANRQGLFYSGQLGKRLDDVNADYTRREQDTRQTFERSEAAREAARRSIEGGASVEQAAIDAALADRQIERDSESAARGGLTTTPGAAGGAAAGAIKLAPAKPTPNVPRGVARAVNRAYKKNKRRFH